MLLKFCSKDLEKDIVDFFNAESFTDKLLFKIEEAVDGKTLTEEEFEKILKEFGKIFRKEKNDKGFLYILEVGDKHYPVLIKRNEKGCYRVFLSPF